MNSLAGAGAEIILLVDDSPDTLTMLTEALELAGLTVIVARDGASAISIAERIEPDLILLDAMMPGLDGFETCRRLKTDNRFATTPVVFMTGLSGSGDVVRGLNAGGVDFITKPVDHDVLIARISVHAANSRLIADAQTALDVAGRSIVAFEGNGAVSWRSPRAAELLAAIVNEDDRDARIEISAWLRQAAVRPVSELGPLTLKGAGDDAVELVYLCRTPKNVHLARVGRVAAVNASTRLSEAFGLTPREGEVLSWLANGKPNKDIAEILSLSPRTVTKHLEQIYAKLGVDNRTAAVSKALRSLEN